MSGHVEVMGRLATMALHHDEWIEVHDAVAELIEAVSEVYGAEVNAGRGTCSPDCMSCRIQRAIARVTPEPKP